MIAETGVGTGPEMAGWSTGATAGETTAAGPLQTHPVRRVVCVYDRLSTGGAALQPAYSTAIAFAALWADA